MLFLPQYERYDGILVCSGMFHQKFCFCLSSQIQEHLSLNIAGKKQNLLIQQELDGTYNIELHYFF